MMAQLPVAFDPSGQTTAWDALVAFFDGEVDGQRIMAMSNRNLHDLVDRLTDFYGAWVPPPSHQDEIRLSLADEELLGTALMYANSVAIPDPIFEWLVDTVDRIVYEARHFYGGKLKFEGGSRHELRDAVEFCRRWHKSLSSGHLIPTPVRAERFYGFRAILRSRERDPLLYVSWEELLDRAYEGEPLSPAEQTILEAGVARFMAVAEAEGDARLSWVISQLRGSDSIAIAVEIERYVSVFGQAASAQARPLATEPGEWEYLLHRLRIAGKELKGNERAKLAVVPALTSSELPFLAGATPAVLEEIRANEDAFHLWQLRLTQAVRTVESLPNDLGFPAEAREALDEFLIPAAAEVKVTTSRLSSIADTAKNMSVKLGIGAAMGAGAVQLGAPINFAVGSAGMSALIDLTVKALRPPTASGANSVLARLMKT
jgi:hypothetical protein